MEVRYEHPIGLLDAIAVTQPLYGDVLAYRFENEQVVGEYSPLSGSSPVAFAEAFASELGTEPEVVAFVLAVTEEAPFAASVSPDLTGVAALNAPPVADEYFAERRTLPNTEIDAAARLSASDWRPNLVQTMIQDMGPSIYFDYALFWDSPTTPGYIPLDYGMETGVDLYNDASTIIRPLCGLNYKDQFFAKNYGWNWYAVNETWGAVTAAQPYADYNDLGDECNRNSIQIGLATPQAIPLAYNNAPYDWVLFIWVEAPQGSQNTNRISGDVALVTKTWCTAYPSYAWTDCMGVSAGGSPIAEQHRGFLNKDRGWTAPNKCWTSDGKGIPAPVLTLPTPTGC